MHASPVASTPCATARFDDYCLTLVCLVPIGWTRCNGHTDMACDCSVQVTRAKEKFPEDVVVYYLYSFPSFFFACACPMSTLLFHDRKATVKSASLSLSCSLRHVSIIFKRSQSPAVLHSKILVGKFGQVESRLLGKSNFGELR